MTLANITNNTIMNGTYDILTIISDDAIEEPIKWLSSVNTNLGGYLIITILTIIGIVLYRSMRSTGETDNKSVIYAGLLTTFFGLIIFILSVTYDPSNVFKLVTWGQLMPFMIITAGAIIVNKINQRY